MPPSSGRSPLPRARVPCCCLYNLGHDYDDARNARLCAPDPGLFLIGDRVEAWRERNALGTYKSGVISGKYMSGGKLWEYDDFYPSADVVVGCRMFSCGLCCSTASTRFWRYDVTYDSAGGSALLEKSVKQKHIRKLVDNPAKAPPTDEMQRA
ncbi:hypothetical protein M885DRAFT_566263 [Pelagophyceae sp. CCMP2097]|nr:hypothetical protein M885DRAFT_566263 [Pelagophyceae sp. CCMP2097]